MLSPVRGGHLLASPTICSRCRLRLSRASRPGMRWSSGAAPAAHDSSIQRSLRTALLQDYFSSNTQLPARVRDARIHRTAAFFHGSRPAQAAAFASAAAPRPTSKILHSFPTSTTHSPGSELEEGSSRRLAQDGDAGHTSLPPEAVASTAAAIHEIPPDASSRLSQRAGKLPPTSLRRRMATYLALAKPRLTFLMVLTTAAAYALYPVPTILTSASTAAPSLSALTLVYLTSGTALCSASANALNMLLEPEHDAKMSRTRNRPLVRGLIGKRGALLFAVLTGSLGAAGLYFGVNPTVSFLGSFNILLYAGVYTPLKRISVLNTWVGALVGAIPPLMGWAAAAGQYSSGDGTWHELLGLDLSSVISGGSGDANHHSGGSSSSSSTNSNAGGWLLATLLYAWQFPHFNALSWTIRAEYRAAGYRMMAWVNERRNARVALRYSLWSFPICAGLAYVGVTDRAFVLTSSLVNAWLVREAFRFYRHQGRRGSARALFWAGVWQLPALLVLALVLTLGFWFGVGGWVEDWRSHRHRQRQSQSQSQAVQVGS